MTPPMPQVTAGMTIGPVWANGDIGLCVESSLGAGIGAGIGPQESPGEYVTLDVTYAADTSHPVNT